MTNAPLFIVGANRSGTTLLRLILNAHSRIAIPEELIYFDSYLAGVPIEQWRDPGLPAQVYARFVARFLAGNPMVMKAVDSKALERAILCEAEDGRRDFQRPYQLMLHTWAQQQGKARWGEKTPGNLFYADIILEMFPTAQFIHMVRDPRAGVSSMNGTSFFPTDTVLNALNRHKHMTEGRTVLEEHVPAAQRMTLQYEDLVTAPEAKIREVCSFLGERYEPAMLRFHEDASRHMKSGAASSFNEAATRPISSEMIDKWKGKLTSEEVAKTEYICAPEMREFGYEQERSALGLGGRFEVMFKTAYWAFQCWRQRHIRSYTVNYPIFARTRSRLHRLKRALLKRTSAQN